MNDLVKRQDAIDILLFSKEFLMKILDDMDVVGNAREKFSWGLGLIESFIDDVNELPSAEPEKVLVAEVKLSKEQIQDAVDKAVEKIRVEMEEPERKKGKWIDSRDVCWLCSECGKWLDVLQGDADMNFCPNCGSRNIEEGEQE